MRIATWNIQHGGSPSRYSPLANALLAHDLDVIVLTEYQEKSQLGLAPLLNARGYQGKFSGTGDRPNGLFFASRVPFAADCAEIVTDAPERAMTITLNNSGLKFLCLHIPGSDDKKFSKSDFWDSVLKYCGQADTAPDIIIGDFNTGLTEDAQGTPFACVDRMQNLLENGWCDAWRQRNGVQRDYSWYSKSNNGFRLDHCFIRNTMASAVQSAYYSHKERETKISDHSIMIVELNA